MTEHSSTEHSRAAELATELLELLEASEHRAEGALAALEHSSSQRIASLERELDRRAEGLRNEHRITATERVRAIAERARADRAEEELEIKEEHLGSLERALAAAESRHLEITEQQHSTEAGSGVFEHLDRISEYVARLEERAEDLGQSMRGARSSLDLTLRELVASEQRRAAAEQRIAELESAHAVVAEREQRISQRAAAQSRELDRLTAQLRAEHEITAEERARADRAESRLEVLEVLLEAEKNITAGRELLAELATEESST